MDKLFDLKSLPAGKWKDDSNKNIVKKKLKPEEVTLAYWQFRCGYAEGLLPDKRVDDIYENYILERFKVHYELIKEPKPVTGIVPTEKDVEHESGKSVA